MNMPLEQTGRGRVLRGLCTQLWQNRYLFLLLLPGLVYLLVFKYLPLYGIQLAFKEYRIMKGITASPWVGFEKFADLLVEPDFWRAFANTLIIAFMKIAIGFPFPILLAVLINEFRVTRGKRFLQTVFTFPHFLSWVVMSGILLNLLGNTGAINGMRAMLGLEKINYLFDKDLFRWLLVVTDIWKEAGWSAILYMAAIAGIDPAIYEAAHIDGANRIQCIRHITLPGILRVIVVLLILRFGHLMEAGFMQVFNLYNPLVYSTGDILDTYVYRMTFEKMADYGRSTAIGLFTGVTNFILLLTANRLSKRLGHSGIL